MISTKQLCEEIKKFINDNAKEFNIIKEMVASEDITWTYNRDKNAILYHDPIMSIIVYLDSDKCDVKEKFISDDADEWRVVDQIDDKTYNDILEKLKKWINSSTKTKEKNNNIIKNKDVIKIIIDEKNFYYIPKIDYLNSRGLSLNEKQYNKLKKLSKKYYKDGLDLKEINDINNEDVKKLLKVLESIKWKKIDNKVIPNIINIPREKAKLLDASKKILNEMKEIKNAKTEYIKNLVNKQEMLLKKSNDLERIENKIKDVIKNKNKSNTTSDLNTDHKYENESYILT